jgi:DNA-binding transcriptional regulator GbsR (MarR family)
VTEQRDADGLGPAKRQFILHWGEMGARWGINRTVAQIQALLLVSEVPLTAEDIAATLRVARSNVSTSIRELEGWGLLRPVHVLGDRRRHYESLKDMWEMFRIIVDQRKRREIDPTLEVLRLCIAELKVTGAGERFTRERLEELLEFFTEVDALYRDVRELPLPMLRSTIKARGTVRKMLGLKGRK